MSALNQKERVWATFCHLSALAGFLLPWGHLLGPLILWLLRREDSPLVAEQGREALNFQLSVTLYVIAGALLGVFSSFFTSDAGQIAQAFFSFLSLLFLFTSVNSLLEFLPDFGVLPLLVYVLILLLLALDFLLLVLASIRMSQGRPFRYPLNLRLIKG